MCSCEQEEDVCADEEGLRFRLTLRVLEVQHFADLGQRHQHDVLQLRWRPGLSHGTLKRADHLVTLPGNLENTQRTNK